MLQPILIAVDRVNTIINIIKILSSTAFDVASVINDDMSIVWSSIYVLIIYGLQCVMYSSNEQDMVCSRHIGVVYTHVVNYVERCDRKSSVTLMDNKKGTIIL